MLFNIFILAKFLTFVIIPKPLKLNPLKVIVMNLPLINRIKTPYGFT